MPAPERYGFVGEVRDPAPRLIERLGFEPVTLEVDEALRQLRSRAIVGCAIGRPEVLELHLDQLSPEAASSGCVDTISVEGNALVGRDSFSEGLAAALRRSGCDVAGRPALVLGAGARARSAAATLLGMGVLHLRFGARSMDRAIAAIDQLRPLARREGALLDLVPLDAVRFEEGWERAVVINATPVGLDELRADPLSRFARLGREMRVLDLVHRPIRTALLRRAHRSKGVYLLGMAVWVEQALRRAELSLGAPVDPALAERVLVEP